MKYPYLGVLNQANLILGRFKNIESFNEFVKKFHPTRVEVYKLLGYNFTIEDYKAIDLRTVEEID